MKPLGWKNQIASPDCAIGRSSGVPGQNKSFLHYVGWMSGQKNLRLPVAGEVLFLTSPFIELHGTWPKLFDAWDGAALFGVPRKGTVEAVGQSFLLPEVRFSRLERIPY